MCGFLVLYKDQVSLCFTGLVVLIWRLALDDPLGS